MRSRKYQDRVQKESTKLPRGSTTAKKLSTKTEPFGLRSFTVYGKDGRSIVSGVLLDPSIYPPGDSTLPDPISHWYGYSASHK
ncbi:unnamed protein product [Ascophyllum nodosum]